MTGMTNQQKLDYLAPYAYAAQQKTGVPASVTLAQWAEETGWNLNTQGNNLFGVKATKSWTGDKFKDWTSEVVDGVKQRVKAWFRSYNSIVDSFVDHSKVLEADRYKDVHTSDPFAAADALGKAGYATNPNYASNLKSIIRSNDLTKYDKPDTGTAVNWLTTALGPERDAAGNVTAGWKQYFDSNSNNPWWQRSDLGIGDKFADWGKWLDIRTYIDKGTDKLKDDAKEKLGVKELPDFNKLLTTLIYIIVGIAGAYFGLKMMKGDAQEE